MTPDGVCGVPIQTVVAMLRHEESDTEFEVTEEGATTVGRRDPVTGIQPLLGFLSRSRLAATHTTDPTGIAVELNYVFIRKAGFLVQPVHILGDH